MTKTVLFGFLTAILCCLCIGSEAEDEWGNVMQRLEKANEVKIDAMVRPDRTSPHILLQMTLRKDDLSKKKVLEVLAKAAIADTGARVSEQTVFSTKDVCIIEFDIPDGREKIEIIGSSVILARSNILFDFKAPWKRSELTEVLLEIRAGSNK